ncbi:MAG: hypothetical protein JNM66_03200 [Bryobacterales bacterium]|nr:hypothetical protein [Bryobacterales bacterium]
MKRKVTIVGQVTDIEGRKWDVCEVRPTKHGFSLLFGIPEVDQGVLYGLNFSLIATQELWDFWDANRTELHGFVFDLSAGRTTLKRMRSRLGFHFRHDHWDFWMDRADELNSLPTYVFAEKYGVTEQRVREWRYRVLGQTARDIGWWRKPRVLKILLSELSLSQAGKKLGISISQAHRLRKRAIAEAGQALRPG